MGTPTLDLSAVSSLDAHGESALFSTVFAKNLLALPTSDVSDSSSVTLTIGSTGDVNFIVSGNQDAASLTLSQQSNLKLQAIDSLELSGGNSENEVKVSETTFSFNASAMETQVIHAGTVVQNGQQMNRRMLIDTSQAEFTGSVQIRGDQITNGDIISRSINVGHVVNDSVSIGYGFRIRDDETLELYKFDSSTQKTQKIALFGDGDVTKNDACSNFPIFGQTSYSPNDKLILGVNSNTFNIWSSSNSHVFYESGNVSVGTSNFLNGYSMQVGGKLYVHDEIQMKRGLNIDGSNITNVNQIGFVNSTFDGSLSTINFDSIPNNTTWIKNNQSTINLSGFNNDMNLSSFYTGTGQTWFDNTPSSIQLSTFCNDIVSQSQMSFQQVNTSNIQTSNITFLPSGSNFTGQISELQGISSYPLSSFSNDIATSNYQNLSATNFSVSNVNTSIIPIADSTYDLGSADKKFRSLYLDGNTLYMNGHNISIQEDADNNNSNVFVFSTNVKIPELRFSDGSLMKTGISQDTIASDGGILSDFDSIIGGKASTTITLDVSGSYNFGSLHTRSDATNLYKWYVLSIDNQKSYPSTHNLYLPDENGYISFDNIINNYSTQNISTGTSKTINISFFDKEENEAYTNRIVVSPYLPTNANEFFPLKNLDPSSDIFKNKFKVDYDYYHNNRRYANPDSRPTSKLWGFYEGKVAYDDYLNFSSKNLHQDNTKNYVVEYISYFSVPFYKNKDSENSYIYYIPNSSSLRKTSQYKRSYTDGHTNNISLISTNLFPRITYSTWENSINDTKFEISEYYDEMKWTTDGLNPQPNDSTKTAILTKFNTSISGKVWMKKLLQITYSYIKYGDVNVYSTEDSIIVDNKYNTLSINDFELKFQTLASVNYYNSITFKSDIFNTDSPNQVTFY